MVALQQSGEQATAVCIEVPRDDSGTWNPVDRISQGKPDRLELIVRGMPPELVERVTMYGTCPYRHVDQIDPYRYQALVPGFPLLLSADSSQMRVGQPDSVYHAVRQPTGYSNARGSQRSAVTNRLICSV